MTKLILLVFTIPFSVFPAILQGNDTVIYNKNILFSPHSISTNIWDSTNHTKKGFVYTCNASLPQVDVFVAEEGFTTCTYICHTLAVGSPRPFYFSKIPFNGFSLDAPLILSDSSKFTKCDSIHKDTYIFIDSTHCYLPHTILFDSYLQALQTGNFAVFKNINNFYLLAKFDTLMAIDTVYQPMPTYYPYIKGFKINWYLQNNGSTDFSNIVGIEPNRLHFIPHKDNIKNDFEFFNVRGQRLINNNKSMTNIVIERNKTGTCKIRTCVNQ